MKNKLLFVILLLIFSLLFAFATTNIISTSPLNRTWTTDTTPSFTVNITNNVSNNVTCELFINGAGYFRNTTVFNKTVTTLTSNATLTQGAYQWYVNCTDVAPSTTKSSVRVFYLDTVNPVGTLNKPQNNTYGGNSVTFNFTGTDFDSNLSYTLFINHRLNQTGYTQTNNTDILLTVGGFSNGAKYNWTIQLTDETSHMINFTSYFTGDTVIPSANLFLGLNGTWTTDNTTTLSFNITDNFNSSNRYIVYVDSVARNTSTVYNNTQVSLTLGQLSSGTHRIHVYSYDTARNVDNSSVLVLYVDNKLPTSTISSPANNSWTTDTTPSVTFTLTDDADGVSPNVINYTLFSNGVAYNRSTVANNTAKTVAFTSVLSQGVNRIVVEAMDNAGRRTNSTVRVVNIDSVVPAVFISTSGNNTWTTDNTPNLAFNITDNVDTTLNYTVYVDSVQRNKSTVANNTNLVLTLATLSSGAHRIYVRGVDEAGNAANSSILTYYIDNTVPTSTISSPANNSWTIDTTPSVVFTLTDDADTLLNYTLFSNGVAYNRSTVANNTGKTVAFTSVLSQGVNRIVVEAMDNAGRRTNSTVRVVNIDTTAPTANLILTANNTWTTDNTTDITFNITDALDSVLNYTIYVDSVARNTSTRANNTPLTLTLGQLSSGTHRIHVYSFDEAGNTDNSSVLVLYVDNKLPTSAISSPANNSWTTDTTPSVTFTLTDDADTLLNYTLFANGVAYNRSTVANNTAKTVAFTSVLSQGVNRLVVESMDNAGRRTNSTVRVLNIDNVAPVANLVLTANNTWITDSTPDIAFNITDNVDLTLNYTVYVDSVARNTSTVANNTQVTLTLAALSAGSHRVFVYTIDEAGNTANSTIKTIKIDTTAPSTTASAVLNWQPASFTVNFTATDAHSSVNRTTYRIDGGSWVNGSTVLINSNGNHTLNFYSVDDVGNNESIKTTYAAFDNASPLVSLRLTANNTWTTDNTPTLNFNYSEIVGKYVNYDIIVDSLSVGSGNSGNASQSIDTPALSSGTHRIFIHTEDLAGNEANSSKLVLFVDNAVPTSVISSPVNNSWTTDSTPVINFTLTDDADSLLNYTIYIGTSTYSAYNRSTVANNSAKTVAINAGLADGTYNLKVEAMDSAGRRTNSSIRVFNVDTTAPSANLILSANNTWITDNTPDITFNITDNVDVLLNYTVYVDSVARNRSTLASNTPLTLTLTSLTDGTHRIHVYSYDSAGNTDNSSVLVLKVDTTSPSANLVMSANNTWTTDTTPTITFNITDALDSVLNYTVYVDSVARNRSVITNNTLLGITLATLTDGTHRIHVYSRDESGNVDNSSVLVLKIDSTNPGITLNLPVNDSNVSSTTVSFNFTGTDNIDTNMSYQFFVNGDLNRSGYTNTNNSDITFSVGSFDSETEYNWTVEVTDNAGNRINATVKYFTVVDTTAPTSAPAALNVSDSDSDGNIELSWLADANATSYRVYRNSSEITDATNLTALKTLTGTTFEDNTTVDGTTYWYAVTSVDASDNEDMTVTSPSYNATANDSKVPRLPLNVNTSTLPNGSVLVSWNATKRDVSGNLDLSVTYRVFRTTNRTALNTSSSVENIGNTTNNYYYDINMTTGTNYTYVIAAFDDGSNYNSSKTSFEAIVPTECTTSYSYGAFSSCSGGEKSRDGTRICYGGGATEDTDTASCSSSGGGSGGSSSSSSSSAVGTSSNPSSVRLFNSLSEETPAVMPVSNSEIGITELKIFVNNLVSRATIVVEKLPGKPTSLDEPTQTVFRYIEIKKVVLTEENIEKAMVKFKIEKKWLTDNNLDVNSVSLLRYTTKWVKLSTKRLSEDNDFIYFESETPGFSYFAIAADKAAVVEEQKVVEPEAEVIVPAEEIVKEEETKDAEVVKEPVKPANEKKPLWLLFFIVLVFGLAVLLLYIKGKRRHESENLERHKGPVHTHPSHVHSGHNHHEHAHQEDHSYDKIEEELNQLKKR